MRPKHMWIWVLCATLGIWGRSAVPVQADEPRDGVFIHVTHAADDPHRVLMALSMAAIMCEDHDVLVYFDIKGVEVVMKDATDLTYSHFPSSRTQLAALSKKGVTLMACPGVPEGRREENGRPGSGDPGGRQEDVFLVHQRQDPDAGLLNESRFGREQAGGTGGMPPVHVLRTPSDGSADRRSAQIRSPAGALPCSV